MDELTIGVDLGGTKTEAVLARASATGLDVLHRERIATGRERGYDAVLAGTARLVEDVARAAGAGVDATKIRVGVGMPGGVTRSGGLVKNSNTTCLNGRPFRQELARRLGREVGPSIRFENDANCFALAEARLGAAREVRDGPIFGVIMGTGVGGGVVFGGRVWPGAQGIAGEWGHHAILAEGPPCYCGQRGCIETFVSGPAVAADYERRAGARRELPEIAARRGSDAHAAASIELFLTAFARGLANVIDILDPAAIVLGGGVSNLDLLYTEGVERIARCIFNDELVTPILRHALGDSAGVLGAALLFE